MYLMSNWITLLEANVFGVGLVFDDLSDSCTFDSESRYIAEILKKPDIIPLYVLLM